MAMEYIYKKAIDSLVEGKITGEDLLELLNEQYGDYQKKIEEQKETVIDLREKLNFLEKQLAEVYKKYQEKFKDN
jgi:predicted  nucleic acid-binding Zn-ribbon protein